MKKNFIELEMDMIIVEETMGTETVSAGSEIDDSTEVEDSGDPEF